MRRFLLWSVVATVVGLALAAAAYALVWTVLSHGAPVRLAPPRPQARAVVAVRNPDEVERLLGETSWLTPGGDGAVVWIVDHRDDAVAGRRDAAAVAGALDRPGLAPRVIVFARPDRNGVARSTAAERATVAELWLSRDWTLFQRWAKTPAPAWTAAAIPPVESNPGRAEAVETSRRFAARLSGLLDASGLRPGYPVVIWRDPEGALKACACADDLAWAEVRGDLDADTPVAETSAPPPVAPPPVEDDALPYPVLPAPPADGPALPAPPAAAPDRPAPPVTRVLPPSLDTERPSRRSVQRRDRSEPSAVRRASPDRPHRGQPRRNAPRAERNDDSMFY